MRQLATTAQPGLRQPTFLVICLFFCACMPQVAQSSVTITTINRGLGFPQIPLDIDFNSDAVPEISFGHDGIYIYAMMASHVRLQAVPETLPDLGSMAFPLTAGVVGPLAETGAQWLNDPLYPSAIWGCATVGAGVVCDGLWPASTTFRFDPLSGGFVPASSAFLGVEFDLADGTHYGWVDIGVYSFGASGFVFSSGWETTPGLAAATPEPNRAILLLLGAMSILCRRRRALGSG